MTKTDPRTRLLERASALALGAMMLVLGSCSPDGTAPSPAPVAPGPCEDQRVAYLLHAGGRSEPFLRDTTDTLPMLVAQLGYGQQDPLTRAKEELARLGDAAVPELVRFVEAHMTDPGGGPRLLNALATAGLMETPRARDVLLRGLEHPQESVRLEAIKGLVRHPAPEDYEHLRSLLPLSGPETQGVIAQALLASDAEQAIADFCTWFAHGELSATWLVLAAQASRASAPETLTRLRALVPQAKNEFPLYLRAALASHGDRKALEALRKALRDESPAVRQVALQACDRAGLIEELAPVLNGDADASLRAQAADRIAHAPDAPLLRSALTHGLADNAREVRKICLAALVERGDGGAQDLALTLLAGDKSDLEDALGALREPWRRDEALARRALEILLALRHGERPLRVEPRALDRALALVPLREAALELYPSAVKETAPIGTLSAHAWYTHQIGNAGAAGAAFLRERWKLEPDALRRLDLMSGAIYAQDESARAFLLEALDDARTTPCEALWIGEQLAQRGPTSRMAPLLKRYALSVEDRAARPAWNELLWRWYGVQG